MMHNEEHMEAVSLEAILQAGSRTAAWKAVKANRGAAGVDGMGIQHERKETERCRTQGEREV